MTSRSWMNAWLSTERVHYEGRKSHHKAGAESTLVCSVRNAVNCTIEALFFHTRILTESYTKQHLEILLRNFTALTMNMKCCACLSTSSQYEPVAGSEADRVGRRLYLLLLSFLSSYSFSPDKMPWQLWPWYTLLMVWHHTQRSIL